MRNPSRRNRNIGTNKQGHGQNNRMVIPEPFYDQKIFWERLGKHRHFDMEIGGANYFFLVEETLENHAHACTVEDLMRMISFLPTEHLEGLEYIVLRQPTKKEQLLNPVWGRLAYFYGYEGHHAPAIILEAVDYSKTLVRGRKMRVEDQEEFQRLVDDGHEFTAHKRKFEAPFELDHVRNTQLYRTFLHEVGHYYQYLQFLGKDDGMEAYERLGIEEKEKFVHTYVEKIGKKFREEELLPFERILTRRFLEIFGLREDDFVLG